MSLKDQPFTVLHHLQLHVLGLALMLTAVTVVTRRIYYHCCCPRGQM